MKVDDSQLLSLSEKARTVGVKSGTLLKRSGDPKFSNRWQRRFCCVYRNLLFYYESEQSLKPNGIIFLEHCTCMMVPTSDRKQYAFSVGFEGLGQRHFIFSTTTALERRAWMDTMRNARMGNAVEECEHLQKRVCILQDELEKMQNEFNAQSSVSSPDSITSQEVNQTVSSTSSNKTSLLRKNRIMSEDTHHSGPVKLIGRRAISLPTTIYAEAPNIEVLYELDKVKKLQGYIRGYLLRKKFRKIVRDYVNSPQADNRRQRNQITWSLLKSEDEYVNQLDVLVNQFQHPCEIAASSRHPPISLENCKAIFRNCEMLLMFHKILLQGFHQRTAKWPVVVISDLMEQMIPMMSCYSNYVQDHVHAIEAFFHVSKEPNFRQFLSHLHSKPASKGLTLPELLAVPLDRISVFMYSVQQLLAHTPPEHVEYNALKSVVKVLEKMNHMINEKTSMADNIRQMLEFERKIIGGCPPLLDEEQVKMREGVVKVRLLGSGDNSLTHSMGKGRNSYHPRICILFTKHLLITTRQHNFAGFRSSESYRLLKTIPLADCSLEPVSYQESSSMFTLVCSTEQQPVTISLMETNMKRKAEWVADLSQCIANERHHKLLTHISLGKSLELDSTKLKFSKYKTGREQLIQSGNLDSLLQRLTTVGYSGMAFINTFLTTFPLFTNSHTIMDFLINSWKQCSKRQLTPTRSAYTFVNASNEQSHLVTLSLPRCITSGKSEKKASVTGILFVLKHWTSKHYYHFEGDEELLKKLQSLISEAEDNMLLTTTEQRALQDLKGCMRIQTEQTDSSPHIIRDMLKDMLKDQDEFELSPRWLLSFDSEDVAQQLTLIEQSYYMQIEPMELITNAWSKKDSQKAPNIIQLFNNFNRNAYNFCWFILNLSQAEERARGLEYLIEIAQHCVLLGNFSSFMQLMSAIEHTSISRLKNSWQFISKHARYQLQELKKLSSTDNKFKALRDATKRRSLPCVPYLGPMLNELAILFEVSPTYLEPTDNSQKLVNFNKMRQLNSIISNIMYYSQEQYDFEYNREILKSLLCVKEVDESTLYTLSQQVEPKRTST